jgi:mannose-6-phosphate isomerase-like protein (cupin superfamily)
MNMPVLLESPSLVGAAGTPPKRIAEHVGRVATTEARVSVAVMESPPGWKEPGQRPEFDEYSIVMDGVLRVEHQGGTFDVAAGQAVHARAGEWVRYSTPTGARYVAVCLPAFSMETVHRDE